MQHSRFGFGVRKSFKVFVNSVPFSSRLNLLSDHAPILLKISNNNLLEANKNPTNCILENKSPKYHWENSLKKSYEKHLADRSNHFLRYYDNVSSGCRGNINSLIEDIVSSVQNVYIHTADKVSVNVKQTPR